VLLQDGIDLLHLLVGQQRHVLGVLDDLVAGGAAGDRDDGRHAGPVAQRPDPGQRELTRGDALALRDRLDGVDQPEVPLQGALLVLGQQPAEVALGDVAELGDGARQHAAAQRRVGHDGDAQLGAGLGDAVVQDVGRPERQLDLDGGDGVDLVPVVVSNAGCLAVNRGKNVRPSDGLRVDLAQPDGLDLALAHQLRQDGHRLLDGGVGVLPRALEDVDALGAAQHAQALVDAAADVGLGAVGRELAALEAALDAEHHLVRPVGVPREVVVQQVHRVALGRAVQLARVPEVGAQRERRVEALEARLLGRRVGVPCHACIRQPLLPVCRRGDARIRPKPVGPTAFPARVGIVKSAVCDASAGSTERTVFSTDAVERALLYLHGGHLPDIAVSDCIAAAERSPIASVSSARSGKHNCRTSRSLHRRPELSPLIADRPGLEDSQTLGRCSVSSTYRRGLWTYRRWVISRLRLVITPPEALCASSSSSSHLWIKNNVGCA